MQVSERAPERGEGGDDEREVHALLEEDHREVPLGGGHDDPEAVVRPFAQLVEVDGPKVAVPGVDLVALAEAVAVAICPTLAEHLFEHRLFDVLVISVPR